MKFTKDKFVEKNIKLSSEQKKAIDIELAAIASDPDYLLKWADVKHLFKRPE